MKWSTDCSSNGAWRWLRRAQDILIGQRVKTQLQQVRTGIIIMPMDIQGRKATSPPGRHFRPEFWAWRPIHALTRELCPDLFDARTLKGMTFGDGSGPSDQQTCTEMANRFQQWMTQHPEGMVLDAGIRMTPEGRFVTEQELADSPSMETVSPYEASVEQMKKWIDFLRSCGGFEVW